MPSSFLTDFRAQRLAEETPTASVLLEWARTAWRDLDGLALVRAALTGPLAGRIAMVPSFAARAPCLSIWSLASTQARRYCSSRRANRSPRRSPTRRCSSHCCGCVRIVRSGYFADPAAPVRLVVPQIASGIQLGQLGRVGSPCLRLEAGVHHLDAPRRSRSACLPRGPAPAVEHQVAADREVVDNVLLDDLSLLAERDDKVVEPQQRPVADLGHRLRTQLVVVGKPTAKAAGQNHDLHRRCSTPCSAGPSQAERGADATLGRISRLSSGRLRHPNPQRATRRGRVGRNPCPPNRGKVTPGSIVDARDQRQENGRFGAERRGHGRAPSKLNRSHRPKQRLADEAIKRGLELIKTLEASRLLKQDLLSSLTIVLPYHA